LRDGRQRHPGIGDLEDRRSVQHVVPHEQTVPPGRLGLDRQVGDESWVGQLAEDGQEQGGACTSFHGRRA
jgi:hypothetical protein